ncbi:hypothetical protein WME97_25440 [Sorangium sp. So ce367]|uniref:hypothetical protein n=1 Tax=Sorangium sp. So ce367 TaxID=3133305 RepID=UPI003F5DE4FE
MRRSPRRLRWYAAAAAASCAALTGCLFLDNEWHPCDTTCTGTCMACEETKTGEPDGTCAPVTANTDPDDECEVGDCGGDGACEAPSDSP